MLHVSSPKVLGNARCTVLTVYSFFSFLLQARPDKLIRDGQVVAELQH